MIHALKASLRYLLVFALILTSFGMIGEARSEAAAPFDALRAKWKEILTGGTDFDPAYPDIASKIAEIDSTAIGYRDTLQRGGDRVNCNCLWTASASDLASSTYIFNSYAKIKAMALAYATKGSSLEMDPSLKTDIIAAMDWLYANRYNMSVPGPGGSLWWYTEIGTPIRMNEIMVLMYDDFTPEQIADWVAAIDYHSPSSSTTIGADAYKYKAANRVWRETVHAIRGIVGESSVKLAQARDGLSDKTPGRTGVDSVFKYATGGSGFTDGFYPDGSFIQHGKVAYNGGYGSSMLNDLSNILYLLDNTAWEVTDPDSANVWRWVYDSYEPFMYKSGLMMDMVRGREIARYNSTDSVIGHKTMASIIRLSLVAPASDAANYKSMVKYWIGNDSTFYQDASIEMIWRARTIMSDTAVAPRGDLVKNKVFSTMARAVHLRPDFGFGLSMFSNSVANYESNYENRKGWYTGSGMTYLYTEDKNQYNEQFWATVNYYRLPGTTVAVKSRTLNESENMLINSDNRVGGVSDGQYGVAGMGLTSPGPTGSTLSGKKSWFMFDDEVVALGSDIMLSNEQLDVETIIDNRKLNAAGDNTLTVNGTVKSSAAGWSESMSNVSWAHLAGNVPGSDVGYYFPGGQAAVKGFREARTGKWGDFNLNQKPSPDTVQNRSYLNLWFDHGVNPQNGSYKYVLLPNKSASQVGAYASNPDITVLENSANAHAVKENNLNMTGIFFWNDVSTTVDGITSGKKASVMVKETVDDVTVSVADPTRANTAGIEMEINKPAASVISADPGITVTQLRPTIKFTVSTSGSKGKTIQAKFRLAAMNENFDSGTTGAAPEGWTVTGPVTIAETPSAADKSMKLTDSSTITNVTASKSFAGKTGITTAEYRIMANQTNNVDGFSLGNGTELKAVTVALDYTGYIYTYNGSTKTNIQAYSPNTWYAVKIVADPSTGKFDVYINGVLKASQYTFRNAAADLSQIYINTGESRSGTEFYDNILVY